LIANHNYSQYLEDAIKSAQSQTVKPVTICIVDDGSTDNSWSIITDLVGGERANVPNLEVYQNLKDGINYFTVKLPKSLGPSTARNIGIDLTHQFTDFYQILDADDVMYSNKLERLFAKINENPEIGVAYGDYDILNVSTGNIVREYKEPFSRRRLLEECIVHSGSMIRKDSLMKARDQFGYYDVNLRCAEDYDLWLRISEKAMICHMPEALTLVRVHKDNATYSVRNEVWQTCWQRVGDKLKRRNGQ
jgi:glycosyltransferase involved in cell wall biosynthesis